MFMNIKLVNSFLVALLSLTLFNVGCASVGRKIDMDAINKIEKGVSTQADVRALIGSPELVTTVDGKTTYTYMFSRATAKASSYIPVVNNFAGGADVQTQTVTIIFDENGVVESVANTMGATETGWGAETSSRNKGLGDVEDNKRAK